MNLKQFVENHIIVMLFAALATGFAAGWGAYVAVQNAAGLTSVSNDHLKELERRAALGREDLERENGIFRERITNLEAENKRIHDALLKNQLTGKSYVTNVSMFPKSPASIAISKEINVKFDYVIAEGEKAYIAVVSEYTDYGEDIKDEDVKNTGVTVKTGLGFSARAIADDGKALSDKKKIYISLDEVRYPAVFRPPVEIMSGTGSATHDISLSELGKINTIHIIVSSALSGEVLYKMSIPVSYTFK